MQDTTDESDAKEQAYDRHDPSLSVHVVHEKKKLNYNYTLLYRNSEYELPDDNSSEGGEVHDEYMSMGRLPTGDINSSDR